MSFGSVEVVKTTLSIDDGELPDDILVEESLKTANNKIETKLKEHSLIIPQSNSTLDSVANYYAVADSVAPMFSSNEDKNYKAEYYNTQADELLENYIKTALKELEQNNHPYSVSTTNNGSTYGEILRN